MNSFETYPQENYSHLNLVHRQCLMRVCEDSHSTCLQALDEVDEGFNLLVAHRDAACCARLSFECIGVADTAFFQKMNTFIEWIIRFIFWMNKFFEWIFSPYNWMNYWMNKKSALFIRKINKKCLLRTERAPIACFWLFSQAVICFPIWMNNLIEWIF